MTLIPASAPIPALSNRLADLAERAGEAARAYRRGSIESIRAYLTAGELLAEARGECRRGEWGAVLDRAGIAARTGRLMVQCWRIARDSGASAEDVHDAGGVQAFVAAAVDAAGSAIEVAARALDAGDGEGEKPALNAGFMAGPAGDVGDEAPVGAAEGRSDGVSGGGPVAVPPEGVSGALAGAGRLPAGDAPRGPAFVAVDGAGALGGRTGARDVRRAAGLCACGAEPTPGRRSCARCRARDRERTRSRMAGGRFAAALDRRLRAALQAGRGLSLSPGDVAKLVGREGRKR